MRPGLVYLGELILLFFWGLAALKAGVWAVYELTIWVDGMNLAYTAPYSRAVMTGLVLATVTLIALDLIVLGSVDDEEGEGGTQ